VASPTHSRPRWLTLLLYLLLLGVVALDARAAVFWLRVGGGLGLAVALATVTVVLLALALALLVADCRRL
jgi:Mg2+/Co2+ transporter CorB